MLGPDGYTMPVCEIDLRPGGAWHFVWRGPGGSELGMDGEYREVAPPERIVFTERWGEPWPETLNAVEFTRTTTARGSPAPSSTRRRTRATRRSRRA